MSDEIAVTTTTGTVSVKDLSLMEALAEILPRLEAADTHIKMLKDATRTVIASGNGCSGVLLGMLRLQGARRRLNESRSLVAQAIARVAERAEATEGGN